MIFMSLQLTFDPIRLEFESSRDHFIATLDWNVMVSVNHSIALQLSRTQNNLILERCLFWDKGNQTPTTSLHQIDWHAFATHIHTHTHFNSSLLSMRI